MTTKYDDDNDDNGRCDDDEKKIESIYTRADIFIYLSVRLE